MILSRAIAQWIGVDDIRNFAASYPIAAPLVVILLKMATVIFAPLSGAATYTVTATLFPLWQ